MDRQDTSGLKGMRVLIVEDQYLIADDMRRAVDAMGGEVVGPCATVGDAMTQLAAGAVEFGLLDINLRGENALPVADELIRRGVPFAFATGYEEWVIPPNYRKHPRIEKPASAAAIRTTMEWVLKG